MVAVDMGEADTRDLRGRHTRLDHLPLRAFARVEEQAFAVPAQQVPVVVPGPGRDLGGGAEDNECTDGAELASRQRREGRVGDWGAGRCGRQVTLSSPKEAR